MKGNIGIILVLIGIGAILISFLMSSRYYSDHSFMANIQNMEVVLDKGELKYPDLDAHTRYTLTKGEGQYKNRVAIPLKYCLIASVVIILTGIGTMTLSRSEEDT